MRARMCLSVFVCVCVCVCVCQACLLMKVSVPCEDSAELLLATGKRVLLQYRV